MSYQTYQHPLYPSTAYYGYDPDGQAFNITVREIGDGEANVFECLPGKSETADTWRHATMAHNYAKNLAQQVTDGKV